MTDSEKREFDALKSRVEYLEKNQEKIYKYTCDVPDWARPTVQKLLDSGVFKGASEDNLNLPETLMRMMVINERMRNCAL